MALLNTLMAINIFSGNYILFAVIAVVALVLTLVLAFKKAEVVYVDPDTDYEIAHKKYGWGRKITVASADKPGKKFIGWSYDENGERRLGKKKLRLWKTTELFAVWERPTVGISIEDANAALEFVYMKDSGEELTKEVCPFAVNVPMEVDGEAILGWATHPSFGPQVTASEEDKSVLTLTLYPVREGWDQVVEEPVPAEEPVEEEEIIAPVIEEEPVVEEEVAEEVVEEPVEEPVAEEEPVEEPVVEEEVAEEPVVEEEPVAEEELFEEVIEEPIEEPVAEEEVVEEVVEEPVEEPVAEEEVVEEVVEEPVEEPVAEEEVVEEVVEEPVEEPVVEEEVVEEAVEEPVEEPVVEEEVVEEVVEEPVEEPVAEEEVVEEAVEEPVVEEEPAAEEVAVDDTPVVEPVVVEPIIVPTYVDGHGNALDIKYSRSITANIIQAEDNVKDYYSELKNHILSYKGVKSRFSWKFDSYNKGRDQLFKIKLRGKTICLYCALNPEEFEKSKYHHEAITAKIFADVPMLVKVKSNLGLKKAKELVDIVMAKFEIPANPKAKTVDYVNEYPYEETDALVQKGLVKILKANANDVKKAAPIVEKEEPVIEEPVVEEPVIEEPVIEEPVVEEPVVEEPVVEEPVVEEPAVEEPVVEEPVVEEAAPATTVEEMPIVESVSADEVDSLVVDEVVDSLVEEDVEYITKDDNKKAIVNVDTLSAEYEAGEVVDLASLKAKGLIHKRSKAVKVLARGTIDKALTVKAAEFSETALKMIVLTGGKAVKTVSKVK